MTDTEIAGYMGWRGPGAYTDHLMKRIKVLIEEVERRQVEQACEACKPFGKTGAVVAAAIREKANPTVIIEKGWTGR